MAQIFITFTSVVVAENVLSTFTSVGVAENVLRSEAVEKSYNNQVKSQSEWLQTAYDV